jgi:hypothetical protein
MMGSSMSAITKRYVKSLRSPMFKQHELHLNVGWWSHWQSTECNLFPTPWQDLTWEDAQVEPRSARYRCFVMRSEMKRRPELVVQTATVKLSCWQESLCWR